MSYSILYRSMFVKMNDGRFIPLIESGSNNCWDPYRNRRSRSWSHHYACYLRNEDHKSLPLFEANQLMELVTAYAGKAMYYGTHVSGRSETTEQDFINYWKRSINRAKTIDELRAAGILLEIKDCNWCKDDAPHYERSIHSYEELVEAWQECMDKCGNACCRPYCGDVSDYENSRLYPKQTKPKVNHTAGLVVKIGYNFVSKMTPRHLHYSGYMQYANIYASRSSAEKVVERIKTRYTQITETPEIIPVRKDAEGWWKAA